MSVKKRGKTAAAKKPQHQQQEVEVQPLRHLADIDPKDLIDEFGPRVGTHLEGVAEFGRLIDLYQPAPAPSFDEFQLNQLVEEIDAMVAVTAGAGLEPLPVRRSAATSGAYQLDRSSGMEPIPVHAQAHEASEPTEAAAEAAPAPAKRRPRKPKTEAPAAAAGTGGDGEDGADPPPPPKKVPRTRVKKPAVSAAAEAPPVEASESVPDEAKVMQLALEEGPGEPLPTDVYVVDTAEKARAVAALISAKLSDRVFAVDTEVADIEVKEESPVGHGRVICFSVYCGQGTDFDGKKLAPGEVSEAPDLPLTSLGRRLCARIPCANPADRHQRASEPAVGGH